MATIYKTTQEFEQAVGKYNPVQIGGGVFEDIYGGQYKLLDTGGYETIKEPTLPPLPKLEEPTPGTGLAVGGISVSLPFVSEEDLATIRQRTETEKIARAGIIESRFGRQIGIAEEEKFAQARTLTGALATERRFSTSAQAYIDYTNRENQKRIDSLEQQKQEALSANDLEMARLMDTRIEKEQTRARQQFQDIMTLLDYVNKRAKEELEAQKGLITASREGAIIDLWNQGVKDAPTLLNYLNYSESGELIGDFTFKEVNDLIGKLDKPDEIAGLIIDKPELFNVFAQTPTQREKLISEIYKRNPDFDFSQFLKPAVEENLYQAVLKNPRLYDGLGDATQQAILAKAESEGVDTSVFVKPKEPPKLDLLTLGERKKLYPALPLSLVGRPEQEVLAELESTAVPPWFTEMNLTADWNTFRQQVLKTMTEQVQKGTPGEPQGTSAGGPLDYDSY